MLAEQNAAQRLCCGCCEVELEDRDLVGLCLVETLLRGLFGDPVFLIRLARVASVADLALSFGLRASLFVSARTLLGFALDLLGVLLGSILGVLSPLAALAQLARVTGLALSFGLLGRSRSFSRSLSLLLELDLLLTLLLLANLLPSSLHLELVSTYLVRLAGEDAGVLLLVTIQGSVLLLLSDDSKVELLFD